MHWPRPAGAYTIEWSKYTRARNPVQGVGEQRSDGNGSNRTLDRLKEETKV